MFYEPHGMRLLATINTNITNIAVYEDEDVRYQETHIFQVMMKDMKHAKKYTKYLLKPCHIHYLSGLYLVTK